MIEDRQTAKTWKWVGLILVAVWLGLGLIRLTALSDLLDNSQDRQAGYVQDLLFNGNFACQVDQDGLLCAKPPLFTWLAGLFSLPFGRTTELGLQLTGSLAVLATMLMLWLVGRRWLGNWAAFFAALCLPFSLFGIRMVLLARTDSLYMLLVAGAGIAAFAAWMRRGRWFWIWFWLLAAAATLTKGPQGLIPAIVALAMCAWWEHRETERRPFLFGWAWWTGLGLFLLLCLGWFAWAWSQFGAEVIHKMLGKELVGHAINSKGRGDPLWQTFYKPLQWLLQKYSPGFILAGLAVWQVWKRPAADPETRRFLRFCALYLLAGLLMFSLASHKRADLLSILLPPAAWLAGHELAGLKARWNWPPQRVLAVLAAVWLAVLAGTWMDCHSPHHAKEKVIVQTRALQEMASKFEAQFGRDAEILYAKGWGKDGEEIARTESPQAFQFYLGTMRRTTPVEQIVARFAGPHPVMVAVGNLAAFKAELAKLNAPIYEVIPWPEPGTPSILAIVSNRPPDIQAAPKP
jgi:4-amino-4-deoxy-L-arabinose transferase-like glycosyltransferase